MFMYDSAYNRLFDNEEFVEILYNFHSSNWENLDKKQKMAVVENFVKKYVEILQIKDMKVKGFSNENISGSYADIKAIVNINEDALESVSQYDTMDTLFHELRHNFQHRAISRNLSEFESVSEDLRKKWKLNFLVSPRGYSNYISTTDEKGYLYHYQPVEQDAFMAGLSLTRKAYDIIENRLGRDLAFIEYAHLNKDRIMLYFSDEEEWVGYREKGIRAVFELFEENNTELKIEKECLKIAQETMKKDIKDMSVEEIISLFSVYVWAYLDDDYKISLLKEYDSRVNKGKPAKIQKEGNSAFKICGKTALREDICTILNELFTYQFKVLVDRMIEGKVDCDPKWKEALALNLYKADGKRINYVKDEDNFMLYSIQPYALLEGRTVIEWFKKIEEVETKFYGVDKKNYDWWIDFYNNDKYIPYIEKFYEKPFEEIYSELVDDMRKKVIDNKKRLG